MVLAIIALVIGIALGWMLRGNQQATTSEARVEKEIQAEIVPAVKSELLKPEWYAALGGKANVRVEEFIASTRVRVELFNGALLNENALKNAGIAGVAKIDATTLHLIM
jgi:PTS system glucose-specific IIC component